MTTNTEREIALREAHCIASFDQYFSARPKLSGPNHEKIFDAAFKFGWQARAALSAAPDAQREQDRLDESDCDYQTIMAFSRLLAEISLTVKGEPENLKRHSYHDLAKEVAICVLERDLLREQVEQDRLDAVRYRWLRDIRTQALAVVCFLNEGFQTCSSEVMLDSRIDAAIAQAKDPK